MAVIYAHYKKTNNEIFYVGIGTRRRAYEKCKDSRSLYWHKTVSKHGYEVEILCEDLTWEQACELETLLIKFYGRRNLGLGPLVNLTDGGEGTQGIAMTDDHRRKLSDAKVGKTRQPHSEETKKKISEAQKGIKKPEERVKRIAESLRGKKQSEETKLKRANSHLKWVICNETGEIVQGINNMALKFGVCKEAMYNNLKGKSKKIRGGFTFSFYNKPE